MLLLTRSQIFACRQLAPILLHGSVNPRQQFSIYSRGFDDVVTFRSRFFLVQHNLSIILMTTSSGSNLNSRALTIQLGDETPAASTRRKQPE
jgi:hypothetical protein